MNLRPGSEREMAAVTFNQKEQRCLERSMKTLQLEYSYQLKLLDLDHRIIRVNYKRLKDKVTKIKSYLTADEIHSLRKLDSEGKIKPMCNSVNLGGTLKIAAAAKRLKCFPSGREMDNRILSADPRICEHVRQVYPQTSTPVAKTMRRSNSVTGVFTDAPILNKTPRRESPELGFTSDVSKPSLVITNEDDGHSLGSALPTKARQGISSFTPSRVSNGGRRYSSAEFESSKTSPPRPATCAAGYPTQHTHSPFSSHTAAEKDASRSGIDSSRLQREVKAFLSDDSIDSNLGEDLYEERRQELLEEELSKAAQLEIRKKEFLQNVDNYLRLSPQNLVKTFRRKESLQFIIPESLAASNGRNGRILTRRVRVMDFDRTPTYQPEEEYKNRLLNLWTDMNKCRYLRVPDELIDLSGIRTLATEQLRLFDSLKTTGDKTFAASAEV